MPEEHRHFYLSEVPSYEQLTEDKQKVYNESGNSTNIEKTVVEEIKIPIKVPVLSGESLNQDEKV